MIKIYRFDEVDSGEIFARTAMPSGVEDTVSEIIDDVRENGDRAITKYNRKFDGATDDTIEIDRGTIDRAYKAVDPGFISVMKEAAANIRAFHSRQKRNSFMINDRAGIVMGQKVMPIEKAGIYVPGGTAAYPSTVLMNCIPAKIAGCGEIVITTPASGGVIPDAILAAAVIGGADRIFAVGGAQAIAALAYGTETIPKVDKIVGPGNAFVAEAKKQVFGKVAIDMIAGPSEILIVAEHTCNAGYVAADMLSQAEHDRFATAVLVTDDEKLAGDVADELEKQLRELPREEIARASIENNGKIIVGSSIEQAIEIANRIAPEHFELCVDQPFDYLDRIRNAGSIFLGKNCPEALGDYFAGANHTLPTSGTARFSSPLSVDDFVKKTQYTYYTEDALADAADKVARFAEEEGLTAHARSVTVRKAGKAKQMSRFIKERYKGFASYTPGEQPKEAGYVKLNTNESPYPPAPSVVKALNDVEMENLRLYPDPTGSKLKKKLAKLCDVDTENIFLSNGSDDILNFAFLAFNDDDDELVLPNITYSFYEVLAGLHGIKHSTMPLANDMTIDWKRYCGIEKNIVIPNPNAPTGIALGVKEIEEIVRTNPDHVVLVDEAYIDFGGETSVPLTKKYDNILVSQTFSKSRSFAGGRLGFAIADREIIKDLEMIQYSTNPYNVNTLSLILAEAAVDADDYYKRNLAKIVETRDYTTEKLRELGFTVLPSSANFVLAKHDSLSGEHLYKALKDKGVLVRYFGTKRIEDFIRVTIGSHEQMDILFDKLREIEAER